MKIDAQAVFGIKQQTRAYRPRDQILFHVMRVLSFYASRIPKGRLGREEEEGLFFFENE